MIMTKLANANLGLTPQNDMQVKCFLLLESKVDVQNVPRKNKQISLKPSVFHLPCKRTKLKSDSVP